MSAKYQYATSANLDKRKHRLAALFPKSKAEDLEIDIFYDDARPLKGDTVSFTLRLVAATLVMKDWAYEGLASLKV